MDQLGALAIAAITLAAIALVVAWIVLPLALIGTKPILREIRDELRAIRRALEARQP